MRMRDGRWPGLAAMYGHKHASTFAREWAKIGAQIASERAGQHAKTGTKQQQGSIGNNLTQGPNTHRGVG